MPTRPPGTPDVDLTYDDTFGLINGGVFQTGQNQPAGTGNFNSFVQIQDKGNEEGYNTDASPQFDEKNSHVHNHSILLADVPIVIGDGTGGTTEGMTYREFLLDLNESNGYISLDSLQIWQEEAGNLTNFTPGAGFAGAHTNYLAYDMDEGGDKWIALTDSLSHGSGQSDYRILIPDSFFINDAAHRYVTLYSKFGVQTGWGSDGGFEEWGLHGASGGARTALNVSKSASVPGDTADIAGEEITYSIILSNTGNQSLTGITVEDPSIFDLTRGLDQVGNNDNILNVGEVWTYTAHHLVTQEEIDAAATGGEGSITNTVSAGSDQTGHLPEQLDTASATVSIDARPIVTLDKAVSSITSTDYVAGTTTADAAGDVINYTFSVAWGFNANTSLTGVVVSDPTTVNSPVLDASAPIPNLNAQIFVPVLDGDSNLGDNNNNGIVDPTDGNGVRDPGETYQYVYIGDTNQDGFHDLGEVWVAYNLSDTDHSGTRNGLEAQFVGDTNNNSMEDAGEKWQFQNVWDVNGNGLQDNGEIWHYQNVGDVDQSGMEDGGETFQYYNAGDNNQNGVEDAGETFQYYNVGDTNHDGVENDGETFEFNHNVPAVDADEDGFNDGDLNFDGKINAGETWLFAASYTVTQDDIDHRVNGVPTVVLGLTHSNTATVVTNESAMANDTVSVLINQNPHVVVSKAASIPDADADGKIDSPADDITYTITVVNDGNMTLTGVTLNDSLGGVLTSHTVTGGNPATNGDNELNVGETWTFTYVYDTQQSDIDNKGNVDGTADKNIHNVATLTTAQSAGGSASADVPIDYRPHLTVDKTASIPDADADGKIDSPDDDITYRITVVNDGNVTLSGVNTSDSILGSLTTHAETGGTGTSGDGILDVGETWTYTAVYDTQQSDIDNKGNVDGTADNNFHNVATVATTQGAGGSDFADVPIDYRASVTLTKTASVPGGTADANEVIDYTIQVANTGNVTLTNPVVTDAFVSNLHGLDLNEDTFNDGDINHDGQINVGETWTYVANHTVTQAEFDAHSPINNAASVATDQGASDSDSASVAMNFTPMPSFTLLMSALGYHDANSNGVADVGDTIDFELIETNTGNVTLHNILVGGLDGVVTFSGSVASLAAGASDNTSITGTRVISSGDFSVGYVEDEAVGQADEGPPSPFSGTVQVVLADLILL